MSWLVWVAAALAGPAEWMSDTLLVQQGSTTCAGVRVEGGEVWTAYHCVAAGGRVSLTDGTGATTLGRVVEVKRDRDLARIVPEGWAGAPGRPLRQTAPVLGEAVWVLGHPQGADLPGGFLTGLLRFSASSGVVSNVGPVALQTTAPVNGGNSGGPVLDSDGAVIGIVSRRLRGDGLGFAGRVDSPLDGPGLGPVGGSWGLGVEVASDGAVDGGVSVGPSITFAFRDRLVLHGMGALPVTARWDAVRFGSRSWWAARSTASLRQRIGRGPWALRLEAGGGIAVQTRLVSTGATDLSADTGVVPIVGGGVLLRAVGIGLWVNPTDPVTNLTVQFRWPGTIGVF